MKKFVDNHLFISVLFIIIFLLVGLYFSLEVINPYFYSNFKEKYIAKTSSEGINTYENIDEQKTIFGSITDFDDNILTIRSSDSIDRVEIDTNTLFYVLGDEKVEAASRDKLEVGVNVSVRLVDPLYTADEPFKAESITIIPRTLL